jgi:hypothetical protein
MRLDVDRRIRGRERVDDVEDAISASDLSADEGGRWLRDGATFTAEPSDARPSLSPTSSA